MMLTSRSRKFWDVGVGVGVGYFFSDSAALMRMFTYILDFDPNIVFAGWC